MRGHNEPTEDGSTSAETPDFGSDFFEQLVGAATDAVVTADADGTIVYANDAVESLLGYDPGRLRGERFLDFVPERLRERYERWLARYVDGDAGTPFDDDTFEVTWLTADGDEKRLSASAFAHEGDGRKLFTGILRNAPDPGEQGERLREEEALIEEIFDTSPVALAVRDADGELLRANDRAAELVGVGTDELSVGAEAERDADDWTVYDADGERLSRAELPTARVLATGEPVLNEEIFAERPDGSRVWLSVNVAPVRDGNEVRRVVSAAEDITELKETQSELEQRREELETELAEVFQRITDAFFALNEDWEFTYVNDTAEELLWRTEVELVGRTIWEEFPEATGTTFQREYERAMETQEPVSFVEYYPPLSTWFEVRAYPSETGLSVYFRDVTDRIQRERELERYETIVETVDDGIYVMAEDMELSMVNTGITEMTGYDRQELLGSPAWQFFADDGDDLRETIEDLDRKLLAGERDAATVELDLRAKDGDAFPIEATWVLQETSDGYERVGVIRDITDRKARQRELKDRVRQQRVLADFSRQALEDRPLDDLFDEAVELIADTLGHDYCKVLELSADRSELRLRNGVGWREGVVGSATVANDRGSQVGYTLDAQGPVVVTDLETEERFSGPELLTSHDVQGGISTVIGSPDEPWGILGTHDASRQSYADHDVQFVQSMANIITTAIRRSQRERDLERYETIVETVDDGIYIVGSDGTFSMVNSAFAELVGYDQDELIGAPPSILYDDEIGEEARRLQREILDGERESATLEHSLRTSEGETFPVETTFVVRRLGANEFERIGVARDITDRKERQRELEAQNERLDAFASMLAHELRNPLEIAQIYLDMGVDEVTADVDAAVGEDGADGGAGRSFREVERALDRIEEMIDTLLVVTRRQGDVTGTEVVDLGAVAEEWWNALDDRDGSLEVLTDRRIRADPSRLRQLLENLFRNAEEHAGPDVTVRVGDLESGFYVEDDGPGIDEGTRGKVFEPGYSTSNVGIGFGLAVVRQLVEAHGWDCEITESPEGGARFEFRGMDVVEDE